MGKVTNTADICAFLSADGRIRKEIAGTELFMKNFHYITENNIFNETGRNLNKKFVKSKGNFNADVVRLRD